MTVVIVDYGMGNIRSIVGALSYLGCPQVEVSSDCRTIELADRLILPGVGHFAEAMRRMRAQQLDSLLHEVVLDGKKPILGICLGMQLMGLSSTEGGQKNSGLGFVNGVVDAFPAGEINVPHVGFNQVTISPRSRLFDGISESADFYFTHSYRMLSNENLNQSLCDYGQPFIAGFEVGNIAGVQFHPELSQTNGLQLLKNFVEKF